ncbi:MAG TPA: glycosyltransferase family 2 protein [Methylomirabilota bacterium]|nr:glycosyltransferase family 2 protein [Methylomirabilota bacterium]
MKNETTVTIGIPAYNEEQNIDNLLQSLLLQKHADFAIQEILVVSDCSNDNTDKIVQKFSQKYPFIKLIQGKNRKGKYFRVNQIFKSCKSDVLIVLDADIALVGKNFIQKLTHTLITDPKAQLVSAHNILLQPKDLIGKVIHANFVLWDFVRQSIPYYDHAANFYGSATAYRGTFARSMTIPDTLSDPHLYIYLSAKKLNGFRYCREAEVLQWPLSTLEDLDKFLNRTIGKKDKMLEKMFDVKIEDVYYFPRRYKFLGLLKALLRYPFYTPLALLLSFSIAKRKLPQKKTNSPIWDITLSSKKPITYAK